MAETTRPSPSMTDARLADLRRQVPRGSDYYEAQRARTMREFPPRSADAGDALNVLRYTLLDSLTGTLADVDPVRIKHAVQIALPDVMHPNLEWLWGKESPADRLAHSRPFPELPPLLTLAETEVRRAAAKDSAP